MPVASWYPWNEKKTPGLQLSWLLQYLAGTLSTGSNIFAALLGICHICHIYTQCKVLQKNLVAIKDVDATGRISALKRCVQHHNAILDYAGETRFLTIRTFLITVVGELPIFFPQQLGVTILTACIGYKLLEMAFITGVDSLNFFKYCFDAFGFQVYASLFLDLYIIIFKLDFGCQKCTICF